MTSRMTMKAGRPTCASAGLLPESGQADLADLLGSLDGMPLDQLRLQWRNHLGGSPLAHLPRWLLMRLLAYRLQAQAFGDLDKPTRKAIAAAGKGDRPFEIRAAATKEGLSLKPGSLLAREWNGRLERVMAMEQGFAWNGATYGSLSQVAKAITGTSWNGHRFFGLRKAADHAVKVGRARTRRLREDPSVASILDPKGNDSATLLAPAAHRTSQRGRIALSGANTAPEVRTSQQPAMEAGGSRKAASSTPIIGHEA